MSDGDRAGEFGPIYLPALQRIRGAWLDLEPLVGATAYDDAVAPTELRSSLSDGLGDAGTARLDIQRSELGMYSVHDVDSNDVNWRFDRHRIHTLRRSISALRPRPRRRTPNHRVST